MKQQEKNRNTLREAIQRLPAHSAPTDLWEKISLNLDEEMPPEKNREALKDAVAAMGDQKAPDQVWKKIERMLDGRRGRDGRRRVIPAAISVAAALALVGIIWSFWPPESVENPAPIAESETTFTMPTEASLTDWQLAREEEEERVFACVDAASHSVEGDSLVLRYNRISSSLDSLAMLLQQPDVHDATLGRFQRLETSRRQTLARIEQQNCGTTTD